MECLEIQPKLESYLDRELADLETRMVGNHLRECAKCASIMNQLNEIERVIHEGLYDEPSERYWANLQRTIFERIGLIPKKSVWDQLSSFAHDLIAAPKFRWALAGAFAFLLTLLVGKQAFISDTQAPAMNVEMVAHSEEPGESYSGQADVQIPEPSSLQAEFASNAEIEPVTEKLVHTNEPISQDEIRIDLGPVNRLMARTKKFTAMSYNKELIPIPNSPFTLPPGHMVSQSIDEKSKANIGSLALDHQVDTSEKVAIPRNFEKELGDENSFTEIMTIVEESPSLGEKRNILLSYISRELNWTYRTLAVYHLALVLYDIAEKEGDKEQAMEALKFFKKHEKTLRAQLNPNGFEIRINALDLILLE